MPVDPVAAGWIDGWRCCGVMSVVIAVEQLSKRYGQRWGVEAVNFAVAPGEIFGFLGPNGAGKTTTIRLLLGFLRASGGRASVFGLDCWQCSPRIKRDVGYLPGDLRLYPWMTLTSALQVVGRIRGRDLRRPGKELADRFQLDASVPVRKMSRGMRQKLGITLALAHRPRLLILDEPTSGLDPLMQQQLADCLHELAADGHTVFFSSHTLSEVEQLCHRVAIVREGRIVANEAIASLRHQAKRRVTLMFRSATASHGIEPPAFLTACHRETDRWTCELTGSTRELLQWVVGQPIDDLTVGQPDLESLFRKYYASAEGPP